MNVFKLVWRNVRANFSTYFVYFTSVAVNVMMYFIFVSLKYNEQVSEFASGSLKTQAGFKAASAIIAVFAIVFISYSTAHFLRRRRKEIALYSLMGVKKAHIGLMFFYENMLLGALALILGIGLGTVFSRLSTLLLLRFVGCTQVVRMTWSGRGALETVAVFGGLFILVSVYASSLTYRFSLAELFTGARRAEEEPKPKAWKAVFAIVALVACYAKAVTTGSTTLLVDMAICLVLSLVGTYAFFSSFLVRAVRSQKANKSRYYRGLRMFSVSQLSYRLNSNARSFATIVMLVAFALTTMSLGTGMYWFIESMTAKYQPFAFAYVSKDRGLDAKVEAAIGRYAHNRMRVSIETQFLELALDPSTFGFRFYSGGPVLLTAQSQFNRLQKARGLADDVVSLSGNQAAIAYQEPIGPKSARLVGRTFEASVGGATAPVVVKTRVPYPAINQGLLGAVMIVDDRLYDSLARTAPEDRVVRVRAYDIEHRKDSEAVSVEVGQIVTEHHIGTKQFSSFFKSSRGVIVLEGMFLFLGLFVGLVFLISTGSIIYFKQLTEAQDDRNHYRVLRQLGVEEGPIRRSIVGQMGIVFGVPLGLAAVHTGFAMFAFQKFIETLFITPLLYTYGAFAVVYVVFYLMTVRGYYALVSQGE